MLFVSSSQIMRGVARCKNNHKYLSFLPASQTSQGGSNQWYFQDEDIGEIFQDENNMAALLLYKQGNSEEYNMVSRFIVWRCQSVEHYSDGLMQTISSKTRGNRFSFQSEPNLFLKLSSATTHLCLRVLCVSVCVCWETLLIVHPCQLTSVLHSHWSRNVL